ncbi:HU family DNA-binding protein [Arthrobacter koreensis]|uniref:HU family DNA-binding protein n=1 Tax=Arthrobacter koreensis TaxID=199136 RepID=UPI00382DCB79
MTENEQSDQQRVSKREFLAQVSGNSDIPLKTVTRVYDAILDELLDTMRRGDELMLTGFGKFSRHTHKGHRVQFAKGGSSVIDDYSVLKFSAARTVNKSLAEAPRTERANAAELDEDALEVARAESEELDADLPAKTTRGKAARTSKRPAEPSPLAKAAAAVQSPRTLNRGARRIIEGPSNRAI